MRMKFLKNNKGFTLIEMISVILVLGIISAVAVPMFDRSTIDLSMTANTIQTDIQYAQELAMTRGQQTSGNEIGILFSNNTASYTLPTDPSGVWPAEIRTLPQGVTITSTTADVRFNQHGETLTATTWTITITAGGTSRTVTVDAYTGRATVS
jgi:MSHA pilin protein MshC